jgi:hypothetical protein
VINHKPGVYKVIYEGKAQKVVLNIYTMEKENVFSRTIKCDGGFIFPVSFEGMIPGEYTIEVVSPEGTQIQKITYLRQPNPIAQKQKYLMIPMTPQNQVDTSSPEYAILLNQLKQDLGSHH